MTELTLGEFPPRNGLQLTGMQLEVSALDLVTQWKRCGLTADFVAAFVACSFARRETAQSVLSTAVNELVENAAKFGVGPGSLRLTVRLYGDALEIETRHRSDAASVTGLEQVFAELQMGSAADAFARRVVRPVPGGLGLVMLARDYGATLGARLGPPDAEGLREVVIGASMHLDQVEQR